MLQGMKYMLVMGGPGSGKSTLGKLVATKLNMFYISKGDTSRYNEKQAYELSRSDSFSRVDSVFHQNVHNSKNEVLIKIIHEQIYDLEVSQLNSKTKKEFLVEGIPKSKEMLLKWHEKMDSFLDLQCCLHWSAPT